MLPLVFALEFQLELLELSGSSRPHPHCLKAKAKSHRKAESLSLQSLTAIFRQVGLSTNSTDNQVGAELIVRNMVSWAQRNQDSGDYLLSCADLPV